MTIYSTKQLQSNLYQTHGLTYGIVMIMHGYMHMHWIITTGMIAACSFMNSSRRAGRYGMSFAASITCQISQSALPSVFPHGHLLYL
jgi:hypothetical protein